MLARRSCSVRHEVGDGVLRVDRSGAADGARLVEHQFGEGAFAAAGVARDHEIPALGCFGHMIPLLMLKVEL